MFPRIKRFLRDESGPTAVEYAVMLALIVIACVGAIRSMGTATANSFGDTAGQIAAAMG